jgi:hypothetical protein
VTAAVTLPDDKARARRNVILALVHVGLVALILAAFVWVQGHK